MRSNGIQPKGTHVVATNRPGVMLNYRQAGADHLRPLAVAACVLFAMANLRLNTVFELVQVRGVLTHIQWSPSFLFLVADTTLGISSAGLAAALALRQRWAFWPFVVAIALTNIATVGFRWNLGFQDLLRDEVESLVIGLVLIGLLWLDLAGAGRADKGKVEWLLLFRIARLYLLVFGCWRLAAGLLGPADDRLLTASLSLPLVVAGILLFWPVRRWLAAGLLACLTLGVPVLLYSTVAWPQGTPLMFRLTWLMGGTLGYYGTCIFLCWFLTRPHLTECLASAGPRESDAG